MYSYDFGLISPYNDEKFNPDSPYSKLEDLKESVSDNLKVLLHLLYKSDQWDEILFERALEEICELVEMRLPPDTLKRKIA